MKTLTVESGVVVRTVTPAEYQKLHAAEEASARRRVDLERFGSHLLAAVVDGLGTRELAGFVERYVSSTEVPALSETHRPGVVGDGPFPG